MAPPTTSKVNLTAEQAVIAVVIEGQLQGLQTAANQLAAMLGAKEEPQAIIAAAQSLADFYQRKQREWQTGIVIAQAKDVSAMRVIP